MSSFTQCPVHPECNFFSEAPPFDHNLRVRLGERTSRPPKLEHVFIYRISHVGTGMCYVGRTEQSLSARWAGHRSARKHQRHPLYLAMNQYGLSMFVMEELEECEKSIMIERELDYMRAFDSWNPTRGYNNSANEETYARKLYFLSKPEQELKFYALCGDLRRLEEGSWEWQPGEGFREPLPANPRLRVELQRSVEKAANTALRGGRRLMKRILSLAEYSRQYGKKPEFLRTPVTRKNDYTRRAFPGSARAKSQ